MQTLPYKLILYVELGLNKFTLANGIHKW